VAKRFTETGKWKKKWIRELSPEMKLFWFYLLDNCDHAGIWEVDIELAAFQIGIELDESIILNTFNRKIVPFKPGKWFIPKFIDYQYGELNKSNRAHLSVIKILTKYGLYKGLARGLQGAKDKDKDKELDKVKDKDKKSKELQMLSIGVQLPELQKDNQFKNRNVKKEFEDFKDYLLANNKRYSNYIAAFRRWLRNDNYRKTEDAPVKKEDIIIACPNGHGKRKSKKGVIAVCPECRESLRPIEEVQSERAIA
jgi:hypothetical protein